MKKTLLASTDRKNRYKFDHAIASDERAIKRIMEHAYVS